MVCERSMELVTIPARRCCSGCTMSHQVLDCKRTVWVRGLLHHIAMLWHLVTGYI